MLVDVRVPVLAESVPDATLLDWKKREGEAVAQHEILIELETDKVVLEVPAPRAGVLAEIVHHHGDTVQSEEVLARIDTRRGRSAPVRPQARMCRRWKHRKTREAARRTPRRRTR